MYTHRHKTWSEAAGLPETAVRLARLPQDLNFPDGFPEPIQFDVQRKQLVYRGFMSSSSYAFLRERNHDMSYVVAIDYLFQESACHHPSAKSNRQPRRWKWLLVAFGASVAAAVTWIPTHRR
jgi:hypothetical protein